LRVGIDVTPLLAQRTGVDQYIVQLLRALPRVAPEAHFTVFANREDSAELAGLPANVELRAMSVRSRTRRLLFQQLLLPPVASSLGLDVLHSTSFFQPVWRGRVQHFLSVHDMTSFSHPDVHTRLRRSRVYRAGITASVRRANLISVPSQFVADELLRIEPSVPRARVRVVPYGIGDQFSAVGAGEIERVRAKLRLPARYILFVGTIQPRKGVDVLVEAYRRLVEEQRVPEHLVLAGDRGWGLDELRDVLQTAPLQHCVHLPGYVSERDLPALYAGASVFVYPSRVEGFGFPPLEAMAVGIPVIACDTSAVTENLRGAAELVPVGEVEPLRAALARVLADADVRAELRDAGLRRAQSFTWERTAEATLACYRELAAKRVYTGPAGR
jgi:glycosyltransferase involved in cell wall biosynthesis